MDARERVQHAIDEWVLRDCAGLTSPSLTPEVKEGGVGRSRRPRVGDVGSSATRAVRHTRPAAFDPDARDADGDGMAQEGTTAAHPTKPDAPGSPGAPGSQLPWLRAPSVTYAEGTRAPVKTPTGDVGDPKTIPVTKPKKPRRPWSTDEMHINPETRRYTSKRRKLHRSIVHQHRQKAGPSRPEGQRTAYILGGGPASGKSTALDSGAIRIPRDVIRLDPDEIKESIPEYRVWRAAGDTNAAAKTHKESKHIHSLVSDALLADGVDVIYDSTGDGNYPGFKSRVEHMRAHGHQIVGHYTTNSVETALKLNEERFLQTGRKVPDHDVRHIHAQVSRVVTQALKDDVFDRFFLYDTDDLNAEPRLIARKLRGQDLEILDQDAWDRFVRKGVYVEPKAPRGPKPRKPSKLWGSRRRKGKRRRDHAQLWDSIRQWGDDDLLSELDNWKAANEQILRELRATDPEEPF